MLGSNINKRIMVISAAIRGWLIAHSENFVSGIIMAICSYFAPVQGVLYVALSAIVIDFITGIIAARTEGKGITSKKLYKSLYKAVFVSIVIFLFYSIDKEFQIIELHKIVAWVVVGFEMWSILENMARITDHPLFRVLKKFMKDKVEENTGINIEDDESI